MDSLTVHYLAFNALRDWIGQDSSYLAQTFLEAFKTERKQRTRTQTRRLMVLTYYQGYKSKATDRTDLMTYSKGLRESYLIGRRHKLAKTKLKGQVLKFIKESIILN